MKVSTDLKQRIMATRQEVLGMESRVYTIGNFEQWNSYMDLKRNSGQLFSALAEIEIDDAIEKSLNEGS